MQMKLLREATVSEEDLGEFHKKIYGCGHLQGPGGGEWFRRKRTHVRLWPFHADVWQKPHNVVK